jgi:hypothetical protein
MSIDYAEKKVIEALEQAGDNKAKARKLLLTWIQADHKLLLGLTAVHLKGIIPYWVERMERKESVVEEVSQSIKAPATKDPKSFGEAMLRSFAGQKTAVFGLETGNTPLQKRAASQKHIDTIKFLAQKGQQKVKKNRDDE